MKLITSRHRFLPFAVHFAVVIAALVSTRTIVAKAGDMDYTFGVGGVKATDHAQASDMISAVFQPDGKYVTVGSRSRNGNDLDFYVLRFLPNGDLDTSFGVGGSALIQISPRDDNALGIAIQPDGKLLIVGYSRTSNSFNDFSLCRLNTDGSLDNSFGTGGIVITTTSNADDFAKAVSIQNDGKIIVAGNGTQQNGQMVTVVRYNVNGTLDPTFDSDGIAFARFAQGVSTGDSVSLQSDGKIVIGGATGFGDFSNSTFGVSRFNSDGSLDNTFGNSGTVTMDVRNSAARQNAIDLILVQPDGRILAVGNTNSGFISSFDIALARLQPNGSVDNSFGTNGVVITPLGTGDDSARSAMIQANGKILIGGIRLSPNGLPTNAALLRYNLNGSLDGSFGNNGVGLYSVPTRISAMHLATDGRLLAAGHSTTRAQFIKVRINGFREADYDSDGKTDISVYSPATGVWQIDGSQQGLTTASAGGANDKIVPADYDGDGKTDIAVFSPTTGIWRIHNASSGNVTELQLGLPTDYPTPGDFDGDGKVDIGVFRPTDGSWLTTNAIGQISTVIFGMNGDLPAVGDYDGDGRDDLALFRPSTATWIIRRSTAGTLTFSHGASTDKIVVADYDGDGTSDAAVFSPPTGIWSIRRTQDGAVTSFQFGMSTDLPVVGDFDGDGKADFSFFRPSNGSWQITRSSGGVVSRTLGSATDRPTPGAFVYSARARQVSGRVTTPNGQGLRNAVVAIFADGIRRTATTSSFGVYTFDNVTMGTAYSLTVNSKRYRFAVRMLLVDEQTSDIDFTGLE